MLLRTGEPKQLVRDARLCMKWFPKLLDERLSILEEDFMALRGVSATEACAWFEQQAESIVAMAFLWDDEGLAAARLDELRGRLAEDALGELPPSEPESK